MKNRTINDNFICVRALDGMVFHDTAKENLNVVESHTEGE
jgi:hypothetical protein